MLIFTSKKVLNFLKKKSADKIWSNKFKRIKMSCPVPDRVKAAWLCDNWVTRKHITYVCTCWTKWTFSKLLLLILELTGAEIKSLPEETRLYESVGRMFMLSSRSEITGALDTKQENCKEKIKNLEANKTYLDRSLKDSENSLRELVAQKKAA